eukprot:1398829-Pyramimonas_sp.AAC.1
MAASWAEATIANVSSPGACWRAAAQLDVNYRSSLLMAAPIAGAFKTLSNKKQQAMMSLDGGRPYMYMRR